MAKASANYERLADETELLLLGMETRVKATQKELARLLGEVPNKAAIMQCFERHARNVATYDEIEARLERYVALRDRPPAAAD